MAFKIEWIDRGRDPQNAPNPDYPKGIDLDLSQGATKSCSTPLPYPAKRIGHFLIECKECGLRVSCTTAGRADDPSSIKVACKGN